MTSFRSDSYTNIGKRLGRLVILTEVRELLKNWYSNFSESLNLSRFLVGPSGTESFHNPIQLADVEAMAADMLHK